MSFSDSIMSFSERVKHNLPKEKIDILQINLGRKCNISCTHCHVEASPKRTEELSEIACQKILKIIELFPQIKTVDLTGGAPEMNYGFAEIVRVARKFNKEVIVRTNLTIFFENNYEYLPEYFADNQLRVVASLPCYLEGNVDKQRGNGVYNKSVLALQKLNQLGYGYDPNLILDLVYNPVLPQEKKFNLTPRQDNLEENYKKYLKDNFQIKFNNLFTITNLPIGRTKFYLDKFNLTQDYLRFLEANFNSATLPFLMCRNQLSIDYLGNIYDCDFNQMSGLNAVNHQGKKLTLDDILDSNSLDLISQIRTEDYCYGCTAGSGSSCGGALL
ncbi:arsenosugar biosynthesis radical SAM (seleno)protein ArsS [Cyanobacterium aponinum]|uniref:Radical SAM domain protein n=1 Tax=Cyanobacterium aponinum (strain PCC 10605) TaxID=755178 RepID=K9YZZ9_CYAAP|nr:arsenosugar biosynthesis radical SAM (seleno)protein ArsS [Cyanobacterium aponinum]AFZ52494.1 Radical SAM domain protein [Cyanobacterium aponinum PCC 10605]